MPSSPQPLLWSFIQIFHTVTELWHKGSLQQKKYIKREVIQKLRKGEQSFLYATCRLDLIHITLEFGQNIPYGYLVMARTRKVYAGQSKGSNYERMKEREIIFARDTPSSPHRHCYEVSFRYSIWWPSYGVHKGSLKKTKQREVIQKLRKGEQSFLYAKHKCAMIVQNSDHFYSYTMPERHTSFKSVQRIPLAYM